MIVKMNIYKLLMESNYQYNIITLKDIPEVKFVKIGVHNNAVIELNGKKMRYRGEVLIFNEDYTEVYLCMKENEDGTYYVPGGSAEPGVDMIDQIIAETREEAGLELKDVKHSGIQFTKMFNGNPPDWHRQELHPYGVYYDGYFTELFVARYSSDIKKEVKNKIDIDHYMRKHGKFYNIDDNKHLIRKEHMQVILNQRKNNL